MNEQDIMNAVKAVMSQMDGGKTSSNGQRKIDNISLDLANLLIEKVKAKAAEMGVNAVVAVSTSEGRPISVQCMDDAFIASYDIALKKTFTSVSLKMSTDDLSRLSQPGQPLYGIQFTNDGNIVIFGGGEPLMNNGKLIGAVGVSGGTAPQDTALAAYGKQVFEEVLTCL